MLSDRVQRQVDRLLDQAEEAIALRQWEDLRATCETLLNLDPDNADAARYLILANDSLTTEVVSESSDVAEPSQDQIPQLELENSKDLDFFFRQINETDGRINREGYLWRWVPSLAAIILAMAILNLIFGAFSEVLSDGYVARYDPSGLMFCWAVPAVAMIILLVFAMSVGFCAMVRRFHDFNWGGVRILLLLVPIVNIAIVFMLLFRSGTQGTNDYGNEPVDLAVGF